MAITAVDKIKINKYLKEHALGDIYYLDMCDALGKRTKITDTEFLDYFTDYVVGEFRKDEKISIKHMTKMVYTIGAFLGWIHESGSEISEETLNKIRSFEDFYDDYLNRTGFDIDLDFTDNSIGVLLKTVNELYPSEVQSESVIKYINKIEELEKRIGELNKDITEVNRLYDNLQKAHDKNSDKVTELTRNNNSLKKEVASKDKEILKLNELIGTLNDKISELDGILSQINDKNSSLLHYKEQFDKLSVEFDAAKKIIDADILAKKQVADLKVKESRIESLIYRKLLFDGASIDDLLEYMNKQKIDTTKEELFNILKRVREKINIDNSAFSTKPFYKIVTPILLEDGQFAVNVPVGCKHYDIMLVSDFHITEFDKKTMNGFDVLNDYCVKNNINLILNLGDFFDGHPEKTLDYRTAIENYKVVEDAITNIPKADGVYHAILGGNHDLSISKYGFDPIKMLADEREDFINLGYTHSTILLNNFNNNIGSFDIHHPNNFDFPINLDENGIDILGVENFLKEIYSKQGRNRDDSYIDVLGHTHKNQFNYPGSFCYIPSYFEGRKSCAHHLKIYFDEEKGINYMVFIPLNMNTKLAKNNEIVYQKVLTK